MSKTPLTDALLNTTYIGDGTHFVDFARKLETDRAELVEIVKWFLTIMGAAGWEGDAATIKARAILARLEAE